MRNEVKPSAEDIGIEVEEIGKEATEFNKTLKRESDYIQKAIEGKDWTQIKESLSMINGFKGYENSPDFKAAIDPSAIENAIRVLNMVNSVEIPEEEKVKIEKEVTKAKELLGSFAE